MRTCVTVWFAVTLFSLTEVSEVSFSLAENVCYSQSWKRVLQIHLSISGKPKSTNVTHNVTICDFWSNDYIFSRFVPYLGMRRRTFFMCISLVQLCTVAVLMCGMTRDRGVSSSDGRTISMLMVLPWYGSSITLYLSPWGVVAKPGRIENL